MFPAPLDEEPVLIAVEYDSRGQRVRKVFDDIFAARCWYTRMFKEGRNPRVKRVEAEQNSERTASMPK